MLLPPVSCLTFPFLDYQSGSTSYFPFLRKKTHTPAFCKGACQYLPHLTSASVFPTGTSFCGLKRGRKGRPGQAVDDDYLCKVWHVKQLKRQMLGEAMRRRIKCELGNIAVPRPTTSEKGRSDQYALLGGFLLESASDSSPYGLVQRGYLEEIPPGRNDSPGSWCARSIPLLFDLRLVDSSRSSVVSIVRVLSPSVPSCLANKIELIA